MDALQGGLAQYLHFDILKGLELLYICIYPYILKFIKYLKFENKNYLALPMLLLEGGQGLDHHGNPSQHMETTLVLVTTAPTKSRIHHHIHSTLSHLLPGGGIYLPIYSA